MIKADDKVKFEDNKAEKFTNFELLTTEVEIIKESIDDIVQILRHNGLERTEKIEAKYFDEDKVFKRLEEEIK